MTGHAKLEEALRCVSLGVSMPAHTWLEMTGLILVGLLPFAALGIALGHVLNVESLGRPGGGARDERFYLRQSRRGAR